MSQLIPSQEQRMTLQVFLTLYFTMEDLEKGTEFNRYANTDSFIINTRTDVDNMIESLEEEYLRVFELSKNTSNLVFKEFKEMIIFTAKQKRKGVKVGSYIEESDAVRLSKSIVNVKNKKDDRCLEHCILQHR